MTIHAYTYTYNGIKRIQVCDKMVAFHDNSWIHIQWYKKDTSV